MLHLAATAISHYGDCEIDISTPISALGSILKSPKKSGLSGYPRYIEGRWH